MIELPKGKTKPQFTMSKLSMLLYGAPKIGKSTFCSRAEDALFIATEPGLNHLEVASVQVNSWREFLETMALLANGDHGFKILVIDTIDKLCDFCDIEVCDNAKIQTLGDMGFGKGYTIYKNELKRVFTKVFALNMGVILTSHAQIIEVDTPAGRQTKWMPTFEKRAREILMPMVDIIGFAQNIVDINDKGARVEKRVMQTKTSSLWEAGDRTGRLPETLPFSYQAFEKALIKKEK